MEVVGVHQMLDGMDEDEECGVCDGQAALVKGTESDRKLHHLQSQSYQLVWGRMPDGFHNIPDHLGDHVPVRREKYYPHFLIATDNVKEPQAKWEATSSVERQQILKSLLNYEDIDEDD